jgi:NADH-quinone oxidoreductase subunit M
MSFPGTSNFIGEFVILVGIFSRNTFLVFCAGTGIVLSAIYSIWLFNRICFGTLKVKYISLYSDMTIHEFLILGVLTLLMFILGFNSQIIFDLV